MAEKKEKNFEEELNELNKIAEQLEKGDLSLEDSVQKFEEGMKIAENCNKALDKAEKKITELINKNGKIEEIEYKRQAD